MVEPNEDSVNTLLNMGFVDSAQIRRALVLAKNDLNDAVALLTGEETGTAFEGMEEEGLKDTETQHGSDEGEMDIPPLEDPKVGDVFQEVPSGEPPPYDEAVNPGTSNGAPASADENMDTGPLEFPTTNLYELEDRVFVENWSIPYKREESLGKCLLSAIRFSQEGLEDENCRRFTERALPESFKKLLCSQAVHKWGPEIHEGIYDMLHLLMELIASKLRCTPIPYGLLQMLAQAFDPDTEFHYKNKSKQWNKTHYEEVFGTDKWFAHSPASSLYYTHTSYKDPFGWLVNLVNRFAELGGFYEIKKQVESAQKLEAPMLAALLKPLGMCANYLNASLVAAEFGGVLEKILHFIQELTDEDLKQKAVGQVFDLLTTVKQLCLKLWPKEVEEVDALRLGVALKMLKSPHFNAKMNSLKEVCKLIDDSEKAQSSKSRISQDVITEWFLENRVLSVAFESNLHQSQYCDRLKVLVEFLGQRLSSDELTTIWKMQVGKHPTEVDNIHNILATAAVRFNSSQLDHLFVLIQQSWGPESDRMKEKLLILIGRMGKEARVSRITTKVLDLLWSLSHLPSLTTEMVDQALRSHIEILSDSFTVKEQIKKSYAIKCVEDIKKGACIVPAMRQLLKICKGMVSKQFKHDKGIVQELNKNYDIIKLTTTSLVHCHHLACNAAESGSLHEGTQVEGRYTHSECVNIHLRFLAFVLQEGSLYLPWHRTRDIWECLVVNPNACEFDREICFDWFHKGLGDLDSETQAQIFTSKILKLDPGKLSMKGFACFKTFFEKVNQNDHKLKKATNTYAVEKTELTGLDYLWRIALEVLSEDIAMLAVKNLMQLTYTWLCPKLKRDPVTIHKKFILECYKRLEVMSSLGDASIAQVACSATTAATAPIAPDVPLPSLPGRANQLLGIERLLMLVEHYIITVEDHHLGPRTLLPHGASFHGSPITVNVSSDLPRQENCIQCHSNESLRSVRHRIASRLNLSPEYIQLSSHDKLLPHSKDQKLLYQLGFEEEQFLFVKGPTVSVASVPTKEELEMQETMRTDEAGANGSSRTSYALEQERMMPGVIMATECKAFDKLYQLAELEEPSITARVSRLLMLLPTDPDVLEALESIGQQYHSSLSCSPGGASLEESTDTVTKLQNMFKCSSPSMSPFRVLYNLEVLSCKLMPTQNRDAGASARLFKEHFLASGGLNIVVNILQKDMFPHDVDTEIRRESYAICLQLARFLLCGQSSENSFTCPPSPPQRDTPTLASSPVTMATGTMEVEMSESANSSGVEAKRARSSSVIEDVHPSVRVAIETMGRDDFAETIACLMRVAWAAAAGRLHLAVGRQRLSSQSSDDDVGGGGGGGTGSDTESTKSFRSSISAGCSEVTSKDVVIVAEALNLLVLCLQLRTQLMGVFYYLPNVNDFIMEIMIGSAHPQVRSTGLEQFLILSQTPVGEPKVQTPNHFLLTVLLSAHVPLWTSTVYVRGKNHRLQCNCTEYFDLLCRLLDYLTVTEQKLMKIDPSKMIENELHWLQSYECGHNLENESPLLAGHLKLIKTLFTCEGVSKRTYGENLIRDLLNDFLYPASKLICDTRNTSAKEAFTEAYPKCLTRDCQVAAHDLLVELSDGCSENLIMVVSRMISMHHTGDPANLREWEFQPPVAPRATCGFVGLKNAGATCYMNSVFQQLFMQPGIREAVLSLEDTNTADRDSVFYQVQSLLGHLMDSKLQFFAPEHFWKCFKLWGQPVNVREQQDAFEFFSNLTDQLDEHLKRTGHEPLFKKTFCGMFADQKICKECNHRYEREEPFYSLQVTVKNQKLEDSLEQFVNGEILEGDNAYFCEKCNERRTTVKRMCIKSLPPVLVIQLKRFGYDWEAGRALKFDDHFEFPWLLNMEPYTTEGVSRREQVAPHSDTESESGSLTDLHISSSSSSLCSVSINLPEINYELVGVIVHSGQANAGHYYSFIKDRRNNTNSGVGKWYKFNDTIVEEFNMTDESLEQECFGGTYRATIYDTVQSYPETRHRYWSGYMLFYEAISLQKPQGSPRSVPRGLFTRHDALLEGNKSGPPSPSSSSISSSGPPSPTRTDGLSQLTALVQKGERKGIFKDMMPASIHRMVHAENLQFMQNRDVYNADYFKFILNLASCNARVHAIDEQAVIPVCSLQLAVQFLFNTYFRTTKKLRVHTNEWCSCVGRLMKNNHSACMWFVNFLAGDRGKGYIRPFLLECPSQEVRFAFARILGFTFESFISHGGNPEQGSVNYLVEVLLAMCDRDVVDNHKYCSEFFWIINKYATMSHKTCMHLISRGAFQRLLFFLVGPYLDNMSGRRWSSIQTQEFTHLYTTLAFFVCSCDVSSQLTIEPRSPRPMLTEVGWGESLIRMPEEMENAVSGTNNGRFIRELASAICDVADTSRQITNAFIHCSWCNETFSLKVLQNIKTLQATVPANDMKSLFVTLQELLMIEDPLQLLRIKCVADEQGDGVLAVIKASNTTDSRRAYQCIKFLVNLANKCPQAKEYLLQNSSRWQWAINWLKKKMNEHYWTPHTSTSNEYSTSRTFQRTSSAADTLAEATALLTELEAKDGEVQSTENLEYSSLKIESEDWDREL